ncbi:MAG: SAM-dependent methyltransferase [Pseudomonadota bacterium]|jgi:SAM-dependent MidA family methyltransferase
MNDKKTELSKVIAAEISEKGPIPFSRYMELCLYHPHFGYYQRQEPVTGPSGDFYTAPHVHALFGRTIAAWIQKTVEKQSLKNVTILELGPGNGQLARDILDGWDSAQRPVSLILVEEGGPKRRDLQARFADDPVKLVEPEELDQLEPIQGVVLANEFFDALPLRIFTRTGDAVKEVFVDKSTDGFVEVLKPAEVTGIVAQLVEALPEGFRTEVSDLWQSWLERISRVIRRGQLLVLDYGESVEGLIVPWRANGSLRCYRRHQVDTDPYEAPGEKDITAHVNYSLFRHYAEEAGFNFRSLTSQSSFLIKGGILEMLAQKMEKLPEKDATGLWLTVKNLVHEDGMGEVFKAMILEKS